MPAYHHYEKPAALADRYYALRKDVHGSDGEQHARVIVRPFYCQFSQTETKDAAAKREAAFQTAIDLILQPAATDRGLRLVSGTADGRQKDNGSCRILQPRDGEAATLTGHARAKYDLMVESFLLDARSAEAVADQAVEFQLVTPTRPRATSFKHDQAAYDRAECCV